MKRPFLIAGNWKMHKLVGDVGPFARELEKHIPGGFPDKMNLEILIAPPFTSLIEAHEVFQKLDVSVAAQNCHSHQKGAFTGEVSVEMLRDIGIRNVIVGHSERRQFYNETDATVAAKVAACLKLDVRPIICVGETQDERNQGLTQEVLARQIEAVVMENPELQQSVIAYEPVWAIGTGKTATATEAQDAHHFIRSIIRKLNKTMGDKVQILYGGSVKSDNVLELMQQEDIDGALIGGASLEASHFAQIISSASGLLG